MRVHPTLTPLAAATILALSFTRAVVLDAQTAPAVRGAEVYAAQKCAVCHSINDVGNRRGPLDGVGSKLTEDEIRTWIVDATGMAEKTKATRRPTMRDYKLPPGDLSSLVSYLASLKKQ